MLSTRACRLLDELTEEPGFLVGAAVALAHPRISNKLRAEGKHFQEGADYAPHQHILKVVEGFITGLKSGGTETPGKERHEATHVPSELVYTVGAALLVLGIRYHTWKLVGEGQSLSRHLMAEIEEAFDQWLAANGANEALGEAWAMHEAHVGATFASLTPGPEEAQFFWKTIVKPLGGPELVQQVIDAFVLFTPREFAEVYTP